MLKIPNSTFYKRHKLELEKFIYKKNSLHLVNIKSKNKLLVETSKTVFLDLEDDKHLSNIDYTKKYDVIVLTDIIENHKDIFTLILKIKTLLSQNGKLIISSINSKYRFIIYFFEFLNIKDSNRVKNYLKFKNLNKIADSHGLEFQKIYSKQLFPFKIIYIGNFINKILESLFFYFNLGIKTYIIYRPINNDFVKYSKSIIVPAKNEEGNLQELIERIPNFLNTEIIFAYGESKDNTLVKMQEIIDVEKRFNFKLIEQTGKGKANAVWEALEVVDNDLIAILDADISVEPETLINFFNLIEYNRADFVNGSRLIYEMENNSMRILNKIGNKFFQFFIGKIINENLTDSLCGTKVFKKKDIENLKYWQSIFNFKDPFGDFDLIFSAAYSGQKIIELPISYKERKYGSTQISRFKDGLKLFTYLLKSFFIFNTSQNV